MNALRELKRVEAFNSELHSLLHEPHISDLKFGKEITGKVYYPTSEKVRYAPLYVNGRRVILHPSSLYEFFTEFRQPWHYANVLAGIV